MAEAQATKPKIDTWGILSKAAKRAGEGGLAGAAAMGINVVTLMWMRTTVNYQYRHGSSMTTALKTLYAEGIFVYCIFVSSWLTHYSIYVVCILFTRWYSKIL
jgi:hypothetical protein